MDQGEFLQLVFGNDSGRFQIRRPLGGADEWVNFPLSAPLTDDVYFRPAIEIDGEELVYAIGADVDKLETSLYHEPSITVVTSPFRHQLWWRLSEPVNVETERMARRRLAPQAGTADWFRLPGTVSQKYKEPFEVRITGVGRQLNRESVFKLPEPSSSVDDEAPPDLSYDATPGEMWAAYRDALTSVYETYQETSASFDAIVDAMIRAEIPLGHLLYMARGAASFPFESLHYSHDRELLKHVATRRSRLRTTGPIEAIHTIRKQKSDMLSDKCEDIAGAVQSFMETNGRFIHTTDDRRFYVDAQSGKAISIEEKGEAFHHYLYQNYRLNMVERECRYVMTALGSHVSQLPRTTEVTEFSWYDHPTETMYLHFGGRDLLTIRAGEIGHALNGDSNLLFQDIPLAEPVPLSMLVPDENDDWWHAFLPSFSNVEDMNEEEASALLHVWTVFTTFSNLASVRPLLVFLGSPGSGKSMLSHRLYQLFYGPNLPLARITTQSAFDTALSNYPLVIYDNVDGTESWVPVKLAQSVSPTMDIKRKLFTNNDPFGVNSDALVGLSSQNPIFSRADVNDRMLLFNLKRFQDAEFKPEWEVMRSVSARRERFLSGLVSDIQKTLRTPRPTDTTGINHRVQDFVQIGLWIATAIGIAPQFRIAVNKTRRAQINLTLDGDQVLVNAMRDFLEFAKPAIADGWYSTSELYAHLYTYAKDPELFKSQYKTPSVLSNKLRSTSHALAHVIEIERRDGKKWSEWHLCQK